MGKRGPKEEKIPGLTSYKRRYEQGETYESLANAAGVSISTLKRRAKVDGWTRLGDALKPCDDPLARDHAVLGAVLATVQALPAATVKGEDASAPVTTGIRMRLTKEVQIRLENHRLKAIDRQESALEMMDSAEWNLSRFDTMICSPESDIAELVEELGDEEGEISKYRKFQLQLKLWREVATIRRQLMEQWRIAQANYVQMIDVERISGGYEIAQNHDVAVRVVMNHGYAAQDFENPPIEAEVIEGVNTENPAV